MKRNKKEPSLAALRKIAACLGCSEVYLIMGQENETAVSHSPDQDTPYGPGYILRRGPAGSHENTGDRHGLLDLHAGPAAG